LGIESLGELEYACNENRLVALKGFGAKTQESVLQSILYMRQNEGFHLWKVAKIAADAALAALQNAYPTALFSLTGDIRSQCETIQFVEIITTISLSQAIDVLKSSGDSVITEEGDKVTIQLPTLPAFKVITVAAPEFYSRLFHTTGSVAFLTAFSEQFVVPESPVSEEAIFEHNNLQFVPPYLRESANVLSLAANHKLPVVIQPTDIKGIIHSHSTASDGVNTLEEMATAAKAQGLEYLVISDHSQSAFYAGGLKPEQIAAQHQEVERLNKLLAPFRIFKSIESDILNDGSLDYNNQVLNTFDLVIASVHSNLKMTEDKAMERVLTAIRNPFTTILGHPTGRLLLSRKGYPLDHKRIIDECVAHNVVIEINAHPRRLDLDWRWIEYAIEKVAILSINPDAHSIEGYKDTYYGVMAAQKGGLTKAGNLSSYSLAQIEAFLEKSRQKR
jgi:DNA polymerase (family 10)